MNSTQYHETDLGQYLGEWVAIVDDKVVAHGKRLRDVYKEAINRCPGKRPYLIPVTDGPLTGYCSELADDSGARVADLQASARDQSERADYDSATPQAENVQLAPHEVDWKRSDPLYPYVTMLHI